MSKMITIPIKGDEGLSTCFCQLKPTGVPEETGGIPRTVDVTHEYCTKIFKEIQFGSEVRSAVWRLDIDG